MTAAWAVKSQPGSLLRCPLAWRPACNCISLTGRRCNKKRSALHRFPFHPGKSVQYGLTPYGTLRLPRRTALADIPVKASHHLERAARQRHQDVLVRPMLGAGGIGVRDPDRRQPELVR